jgi:hypothetical protein
MTFFADLGQFQQGVAAGEARAYGQGRKVNPARHQIFAKAAKGRNSPAAAEFLNAFQREQTDLTVPATGMSVIFKPVIFHQQAALNGPFGRAFAFTGADGDNFSHVSPGVTNYLRQSHEKLFPRQPHSWLLLRHPSRTRLLGPKKARNQRLPRKAAAAAMHPMTTRV